jgi:diguanylate cyclase (GGDEF)-like protein/PAS domain S-box-containing protein
MVTESAGTIWASPVMVRSDLAAAPRADADVLDGAHRFEAMFHDHGAVMLLIDPVTGAIVDANPSASEFYGYSLDELRSMSITQINVMPAGEVADLIARADSDTHAHFVCPHRLATGEIRRVDVHSSPISDGRPLLFSIIVDVEQRARAEEELARVSAYSRTLIEASLDPLVTISADGVITDVNAATEAVTGVSRQTLIGSDFATYFTDPGQARAGYVHAFTHGSVTDHPLAIRHVDGTVTEVLYNATVYRDAHGDVAGVFAAARNITEQKRAQAELAIQSQRLELVLASSRLGLWDWNMVSGDAVFDERWAHILGHRLEDLQPVSIETWFSLIHPDDLVEASAAIDRHARGLGAHFDIECRMRHSDGHWVWVHDRGQIVERTPDGHPSRMTGTREDISRQHANAERLAASEELLRAVLDTSSDAVIRFGPDGRIEYVNSEVVRNSGVPLDLWVGKSFAEMGYGDFATAWDAYNRHVFDTGDSVAFEFEIDDARGHRWYETKVTPEVGADGSVSHVIQTSRDITDRIRVEAELRSSQAQLEQAQRIAHVGSWTLDNATNHVAWSEELFLMQGLDPTSLAPSYTEHSRLFTPASWQELSTALTGTAETGAPYELELEMVRPDGSHGWMLARGEAVRDATGTIVGLQGVAVDITDRRVATDQLRVQATHDPLTGLANRAALLDEIARAISSGLRLGRSVAVLMMDLDRFKEVNDTLGHAAGDDLLVAAAARLKRIVRAGDLVARLGGDEFVVVMRDLEDPTDAVRAAGRLVEAFRTPFTPGGRELFATASVGVAVATDAAGAGDLLREADTAMYAAKAGGRDRVSMFNEDLRTAVTSRLTVEADLRHALERDQLAVWYQPEVDLTNGSVIALEALLRWHHPDGTVWTADRFVGIAEDTGLILDIGEWVLRMACTDCAAWSTLRPGRPLTVRVNLSALQIAEPGLLDAVDDALASSGLDPALLSVEITETALLRRTTTMSANLAGIHDRGISIAIDDFGTGYASLTYLNQYPIDCIKIDRSFIDDTIAPDHDHDHGLVAGIIALAAILDITVTAEGVEEPHQASYLRQMGCPSAQGWFYSKAIPPESVTQLLDLIYPHA